MKLNNRPIHVIQNITPCHPYMVSILDSRACFLKAPKSFRARKATFRSSVSKNGEVYTPETFCMKGTFLHL